MYLDHRTNTLVPCDVHCFLFSRIIGYLTPKIIYFYYLKKYFLDQSIPKIFNFILKKEALVMCTATVPQVQWCSCVTLKVWLLQQKELFRQRSSERLTQLIKFLVIRMFFSANPKCASCIARHARVVSGAAKFISKLNYYIFGYFDPTNNFFDNKNK